MKRIACDNCRFVMRSVKIQTTRITLIVCVFSILLIFMSCTKTVTEKDLFYPRRLPLMSDKVKWENVSLVTKDSTTIRGWLFRSQEYKQSMLYFYGNGETLYSSQSKLYWLSTNLKCNILAFDYRGYGFSDGSPSFITISNDALEEYDYLKDSLNISDVPIFVFGYSIGTAFAMKVAANRKVDGLILMAPMTSAAETIPEWKRFLPWYIRWCINLKPDDALLTLHPQPDEMIQNIDSPLLVIHGDEDKRIPIKLGKCIFEKAGSKHKHWCEVTGHGHNDLKISVSPISDSLLTFVNFYGIIK